MSTEKGRLTFSVKEKKKKKARPPHYHHTTTTPSPSYPAVKPKEEKGVTMDEKTRGRKKGEDRRGEREEEGGKTMKHKEKARE